jgi:UDP-N-acetylmuramoyl-L-alanyl-D-glutamate--2,6-diaminopimelate ligase
MQACSAIGSLPSLHQLLPDAELFGADDVPLTGCACDSRRVRPGDAFVAIRGGRADGREFLTEAIQRGAAAVICEAPAPEVSVPVCLVRNAREAFARLCQQLAGNPSHALKLIGVTGTTGKTTTACLIASVLTTAGMDCGVLGTLGYFDGETLEPAVWTTPPADKLAHVLARSVANGCTHAVMEVSSHALDQMRVAGLRFDAACVTNVRRDHLDYHATIADYRLTKSKLFQYLPPEGFAVVNADDPTSASYLRQLDTPALTVGVRSAAEFMAMPIEQLISEQTFLLTAGSEMAPVRTRMIGLHNVYNCLVAAAVGLAYGIDLMTVVRGLESLKQVPGRLERIECGQPFGVFVDFAHTPDALAATLRTLRSVTAGKLICVFGASGERDKGKRPLMGRTVERLADLPIVTSDNPRSESPATIIADVLAGFADPREAEVVPDRATAIRWALAAAQPGDCVLIAGKGHETCQIVGDERIPFDDREIAREWLYEVRPFAEAA